MTTATYMPILKGKQGELWALREQGFREGVYPVIEVPRIKWDYDAEAPAKSIQTHVSDFLRGFERTLGSIGKCAVDACLLDGDGSDDSTVALREILERSVPLGLPVTPTTGLSRSNSYSCVAGEFARRHTTGCVVRFEREDLYDVTELKAATEDLLGQLRLKPDEIDLVVDLGFLREDDEHEDLDFVMQVLPQIPYLSWWRSFWFSGGSFPEFLTSVEPASTEYIPRVEWTIWNGLARGLTTQRVPRYSDYGVSHPISPDVDGRVMNMSANIRYTTDHHWLIVKGRSTRSHGYSQFQDLCRTLIESSDYCGRNFSPGDAYFDDCASEVDGPGNATKWRQAGSSHHMEYVAIQVEKAKRLLR